MKKIIKAILFLLIPIGAFGQLAPVTDQYILNPLSINPAFAGNRGALNLAAYYRRQWVGITGAPETMTFAVDAPLPDSRIGLGLIVTNDKVGVTKNTQISTVYAYKISLGKGFLSLGLGAGIIATNTVWSDLTVNDPGDEFYLADSRVFIVPDFSFGAYYNNQNFFAGISIPKLIGYKFNFDKNKYSLTFNPGKNNYMLNTGYMINLSPKIRFLPSTLVTFSPGEKILYDLNAHFIFLDRLWGGLSYQSNCSIAGLIQFAINTQLKIAYTYGFTFGDLSRYNNGSHEIMIRYEFRYKVNVVNPLIF